MAKKLRKTLPKNFGEIVESGDLEAMKAVFATSELDAYGGSSKDPALSTYGVPDALVRWLVAQGADLHAANAYGETPLHHHAGAWNGNPALLVELGADVDRRDGRGQTALFDAMGFVDHARVLVDAGADVDAENDSADTPLLYALRRCRNADIDRLAPTAQVLIQRGATVTDEMRAEVARIGHDFESGREAYNPDSVAAADAALHRLYELFAVAPAPVHVRHDGVSPITVTGGHWRERHQALWEILVPPMGAAPTVQGELVRITGRVAHEIDGNGGVNWDAAYRAMVASLAGHLSSGEPLDGAAVAEVREIVAGMRGGDAHTDELDRLCELAVAWVQRNPTPIALSAPGYAR